MAVTDEQKGAITGVVISLTTAAVAYGLRRALVDRERGLRSRGELPTASGAADGDHLEPEGDSEDALHESPLLKALKQLAAHALLPIIEQAARHAGAWVGEKAPGADRSPLGLQFVEAFHHAAALRNPKSPR
jgi:hypothetical protein